MLAKIKQNKKSVWDKILEDGGSVQGVDILDEYWVKEGSNDAPIRQTAYDKLTDHEKDLYISVKDVFRTFKEINQMELVKQAGVRQQYVDQAVSLNLAFPTQAEPKYINQVHLEAYKQGIKTLYYMRTESVLRGDIAQRAMDDCLACDG
jgi:ribonucleotide reductase alpha subunit